MPKLGFSDGLGGGFRMVPGVLPDETRSRSVYTQRY